ncbi:MFS general substrate transporter [Zalerion maritima]|uniref:MFS general substrate transporter n=1 Tax=Zalerion maritima TaxID=339359 RepID=A0AAD5RFQ7_9PEZI|nr:MFS general substrate transporter [Zalerion maritima]
MSKGLSHVSSDSQETSVEEFPDPDKDLPPEERARLEKALVWKLDMRLIPWLSILYLLAFLDRANIGNAKIAGLVRDLGLSTNQFNASLTIFFVSYSVFEPLTNIMLKRLRPSVFIPLIMVFWGLTMTFMGFCTNYGGLMAARWFLGLTEAGLFPGINYYLSCWYKRSEFGVRAAIFFSAAAISGSFGGLLAAAIEQMDGLGGKAGWSWIFIIEGAVTVVFGLASFWTVYDFPTEAKFLSSDDKARVLRRLKEDHQSSAERESFKWSYFWSSVRDWKMWAGMTIYMGTTVPVYAFSIFLPSIIHSLGWSTTVVKTQLYSVPPYIAAALLTVGVGYLADRTRKRGIYNMLSSLVGCAGFIMLLASSDPAVKYSGTFLGALGIYPCIANTITWMANNTEGVYRRGVVLGFVIGWGNLCGIISSNIYFNEPKYIEGHAVVFAFMFLFLFGGSLWMHVGLKRENGRRRRGERDVWMEGKSEKDLKEMGDLRADFIYTL